MDIRTSDFVIAYQKLLPPGSYWEKENSTDLEGLIEGMALDATDTHQDIEALLYQSDKIKQGWKIADYQALLSTRLKDPYVYDAISEPHRIFISYTAELPAGTLMQSLENYRLAHTVFGWVPQNHKLLSAGAGSQTISTHRSKISLNNELSHQCQVSAGMARSQIVIIKKTEKVT